MSIMEKTTHSQLESTPSGLGRYLSGRSRAGADLLVGMIATTLTPLKPRGQIRVAGEIWEARCADQEGSIAPGRLVKIRGHDNFVLEVESAPAGIHI